MPSLNRRLARPRKIDTSPAFKYAGRPLTRARVIEGATDDSVRPYMRLIKGVSSQQLTDPFKSMYTQVSGDSPAIIPPEYPLEMLVRVGKQNSALNQCIEAYQINIEAYGYQLEYVGSDPKQATSSEALAQKNLAITFLDFPNGEKSLRTIREETRKDLEYMGNRYFEFGRDARGRIAWMDNVQAISMRMTKKDKEPTPYETLIPRGEGFIKKKWSKHFRRFVQVGSNGQKVYFKEFGDPRPIDPKTGNVNPDLSIEDQATEIYHQMIYSPGTAYGVPRWLGALPSMLGLRESEMVNLNFFRENAIPAMAVLISGGALTEESFEKITSLIQASKGRDAHNRVLILEAVADDSGGSTDGAPPVPRIDMKPMTSERQSEGQFKDYEASASNKIKSTMRLPAIYTGQSEDYTKATAQAGQRIAESQVFAPERSAFDDFMNTRVLATLGINLWRFKTMGPSVYDPESLANLVDRFAKNGAITPNILIKIANQVLDVQIPDVGEEWGNIPFSYAMQSIQSGYMIKDFQKVFVNVNDTLAETVVDDTNAPVPANDQVAAARKMIRRELAQVTQSLLEAVEDVKRYIPEAA